VERPGTRKALWGYVLQHFGLALPWRKHTAGHSSPFDFVADAVFNPADSIAAWACRSGGKTLAASIVAALLYRFAGSTVRGRILSGSADQANNMYDYW